MSKRGNWLVVLSLLSVAVVAVMAILAYLLVTLPAPSNQIVATPSRPVLNLPTAPPPTTTPGPRLPTKILFEPEQPISGYSNCDMVGFRGRVTSASGDSLPDVQIVVWDDVTGLVVLDTTRADGTYSIRIYDKPTAHNFWVQIYENDIPVSEPVLVKTQIDCHTGFQIYQVNWHELPKTNEN